VLNLLDELREQFGFSYLFIAHGLNVVKHVSDRVGVMYLGKLMEISEKNKLYREPLCPYTQALLSAIPSVDPHLQRKRIILEGDVPSPIDPPPGCRFASRCFVKTSPCDIRAPKLTEVVEGHWVACHHYGDKKPEEIEETASFLARNSARMTFGRSADPDTREGGGMPVV